jgi:long-chain fatty acid transport protein
MKTTKLLLPATTFLATTTGAFALGVRIADQDPFATARGNAFAATADNPSAIYYNPAGITQLEGLQARVGVYSISLNSDFERGGFSQETVNDWAFVPQLFCTYTPKDWPVSFGLGVYAPYGLSNEWPDDSPFRTLATRGEIIYSTVQPVIAWKACENFSIAAGPTFNTAEAELSRGIIPFPLNPGDQFRFRGKDDLDIGFTVGAMLTLGEKHSFGVTYRSETEMEFEGRSRTKGADAFGVPSFSQRANATFQFPQNVVVGYSFRPTPDWNIEFNLDWTDWDSLDTVVLQQAVTGPQLLPFKWKSSFFYELGVTRKFQDGWRVSGGYIFSENSVPDRTFNPVVPDSDRHIWSLGVGRDYEHWRWDFAYQLAWGPQRNVTASTPNPLTGESADGRYEFLSHALTFSIGYRF